MKGKSRLERSKRSVLAPEDQALFAEAMNGVTPLAVRDRVAAPRVPASPVKIVELPPEVKLTVEGDGQRYAARAAGVSLSQVSELRAGKVRAEATLDLHGEQIEPALARLQQFLVESRRMGRRCVLEIHGQGTPSEHGAPLRESVLHALLGALSGVVHALASAARADGGEGATYVMLRGAK